MAGGDPRTLHLDLVPVRSPRGLTEASVVVIDVLRASTTVARAFEAGAAWILPVGSVERARALHRRLGADRTLLCGERGGNRLPGFHLGNSPREYLDGIVGGKGLILCSTNGSGAVVRYRTARAVALAAFVNAGRASAWLAAARGPRRIVCAGTLGSPCLEDAALGGRLVDALATAEPDLRLNDQAVLARDLWRRRRDAIPALLRDCDHGRTLAGLGFAADLEFCAGIDTVDAMAVLRDGRLVNAGGASAGSIEAFPRPPRRSGPS